MKQEIREAAINKWWDSYTISGQVSISEKYGLRRKQVVADFSKMELIYLKEQESKEVSNVSEMGVCEFCGIEQPLSNLVCYYSVCGAKVVPKEEPVSESVEEAADRLGYNNDEIQPYFKEGFIACADWMKGNNEQMLNEKFDIGFTAGSNATAERFQSMLLEDKELIRELLNLIGDEQHPTITKATQYLNQ